MHSYPSLHFLSKMAKVFEKLFPRFWMIKFDQTQSNLSILGFVCTRNWGWGKPKMRKYSGQPTLHSSFSFKICGRKGVYSIEYQNP